MRTARYVLRILTALLAVTHAYAAPATPLDRIDGRASAPMLSVLPDNTTLTIELLDVSKADAKAERLARLSLPSGGRQFPLVFELPYYRADIRAGHRYGVRAMLTSSGGEMLYTTAQHTSVLTQGAGKQVQLVLQPIQPMSDAALENTYWKLVAVGARPTQVQPGEREAYLLLFDGRVSGSSGCNKLMGSYTRRAPGELHIGPLGMTRMACLPGVMEQEAALVSAYARVTRHRITGDTLDLMEANTVLVRFKAYFPQ